MPPTPNSQEMLTFVVRLWRDTDAAGAGHWRGRVENVETREACFVEGMADVIDRLEHWVMLAESRESISGSTW
jgi:hypothetical protein